MLDADMQIASREEAEKALKTIGYYRLRGYCFHRYDHANNKYLPGTDFTDVLRLYEFDTKLSRLIFDFSTRIEVALRARLVNALLQFGDALVLHDPSYFEDKQKFWENQSAIASEITRSKDIFIKHNFKNHDGAIPLWAAVEIMSFGTLSKVINTLKTGQNTAIAVLTKQYPFQSPSGKSVSPSKDMFASWIQAAAVIRNICAHNSRIHNRSISVRPVLLSEDKVQPSPKFTGLYEILLALKYLRPSDELWNRFAAELYELLDQYTGVYELKRLNFPKDFKTHFKV